MNSPIPNLEKVAVAVKVFERRQRPKRNPEEHHDRAPVDLHRRQRVARIYRGCPGFSYFDPEV